MLPRRSGGRRTHARPRQAIAAITVVSTPSCSSSCGGDDDVPASTYSFGVLLAFTAAQVAVLRMRVTEPDLPRPFRARPEVTIRGVRLPLPALIGAPLTLAVFVIAMVTHEGARSPTGLPRRFAVAHVDCWREHHGARGGRAPTSFPIGAGLQHPRADEAGDIGEMVTPPWRRKEKGARIEAITVVKVPRERALEADLPADVAESAEASLAEARALGEENGVEMLADAVRARSIGHAIVEEAERRNVDLIVLGSSARWRRQSRFFSPTVDHVLQHATCEVLVVAYPDGVFDGE
jgi:APA family basic amino acid/polyamine antiporter